MIPSAPGVWTITLPVPWELETVNAHLVKLDDGFLLVDTGVATEECFDALEAGLAEHGAKWTDVRTLLLTHYHPDHVGLSWKILELSRASLIMHRADVAYLEELARFDQVPAFHSAMKKSGVPEEFSARIESALRGNRPKFRGHQPDWILDGGERINVHGGALEAIWTPGHTPGHVCLYSREHRYLISGDHLLQTITPNIAWHPDQDMLAQYLDSLELIGRYDAQLVLPSHGGPFRGHRERIRETARHHEERCGAIVASVARRPMTVHELVLEMWPRKLSPFHHSFAVFEILAHLEFLAQRGKVSSQSGINEALMWIPA